MSIYSCGIVRGVITPAVAGSTRRRAGGWKSEDIFEPVPSYVGHRAAATPKPDLYHASKYVFPYYVCTCDSYTCIEPHRGVGITRGRLRGCGARDIAFRLVVAVYMDRQPVRTSLPVTLWKSP